MVACQPAAHVFLEELGRAGVRLEGPERGAGGQDHHTISLWVSPLESESVSPSGLSDPLQPQVL